MNYDEYEESCIRLISKRNKEINVCVVPKEDMSKKCIVIFDPDGKEKWFNKVPDAIKHLRKLGVRKDVMLDATRFLTRQLRSLRRRSTGTEIGTEVFKVGRSREEEV
jgi:hypothetical protein